MTEDEKDAIKDTMELQQFQNGSHPSQQVAEDPNQPMPPLHLQDAVKAAASAVAASATYGDLKLSPGVLADVLNGMDSYRQRQKDAEAIFTGIREAAYRHIAALCGGEVNQQFAPVMSSEYARRLIRIEVTHDCEAALMYAMRHMTYHYQRHQPGPMQFEGVDVYVVPDLPQPGWRIVNPYEKLR